MADRRLLTDCLLKSLRPAPVGTGAEVRDGRVSGFGIRISDIEDVNPARRGKAGRPTKCTGNARAENFADDSIELDALLPDALCRLIRQANEKPISPARLAMIRNREDTERKRLHAMARRERRRGE